MGCNIVGSDRSKLRKLMQANLENITIPLPGITVSDTSGLSKGAFVPLADVPDLVWKMPSGDGSRGPRGQNPEAPNHFANMDQTPPGGGPTLLQMCQDPANITPDVWIEYARKFPPKNGSTDAAAEMGLLPFRVWQIYDAMVEFLSNGQRDEFIAAAGTLAHYVGDACQPLHISFLHHGDPDHPVTKTITHTRGQHSGESEVENLSQGVHEDYEQTMFRDQQGEDMKNKLQALLKNSDSNASPIKGGHAAAVATVQLMTDTFNKIHPKEICDLYDTALRSETPKGQILSMLWDEFGGRTVEVMAAGCRHLALLWESAWAEGRGDDTIQNISASARVRLSALYEKKNFLQSFLLTEVGPHLKSNGAVLSNGAAAGRRLPRKSGPRTLTSASVQKS